MSVKNWVYKNVRFFFLKENIKTEWWKQCRQLILVEGAVDSVLDVYTNLVTSRVFEVPEISLWVMYQLHVVNGK
jgi:hypothetical protein